MCLDNLTIGTLNVQDMGAHGTEGIDEGKTDEIIYLMDRLDIDVLALQETKRPYNDVFRKDDYVFVFASNITTRKPPKPVTPGFTSKANKANLQKQGPKGTGKGKRRQEFTKEADNREHIGVGFCHKQTLEKGEANAQAD